MKRLPKLDQVTAYLQAWQGIREGLPPSGAAYLVGLLHGQFDEATATHHLRAIDALCRLKPGGRRQVVAYLAEHGIADYRPRSGFARTVENP